MGLMRGQLTGRWLRVAAGQQSWEAVSRMNWARWAWTPLAAKNQQARGVALLWRPDRWSLNEARLDGDLIVGVIRTDTRRPNRTEYKTRCQTARVWKVAGARAKDEREAILNELINAATPSTGLVEWAWHLTRGLVWVGSAAPLAMGFMEAMLSGLLDKKTALLEGGEGVGAAWLEWLLMGALCGRGDYELVREVAVMSGAEVVTVKAVDVLESRALAGPMLAGASVERLAVKAAGGVAGLEPGGAWRGVKLQIEPERGSGDEEQDLIGVRWDELLELRRALCDLWEEFDGTSAADKTALLARAATILEHVPMQGTLMDAIREGRRPVGEGAAEMEKGALARHAAPAAGMMLESRGKSVTLDINMDANCAECGHKGATPSGLCLGCAGKAISVTKTRLKSAEAKAMRKRAEAKRR